MYFNGYIKIIADESTQYCHASVFVFMARRAIPMIAFHGVESIYIYFFLCSLARVCVVYVVKEVASFPGARSINGCGA